MAKPIDAVISQPTLKWSISRPTKKKRHGVKKMRCMINKDVSCLPDVIIRVDEMQHSDWLRVRHRLNIIEP